MSHPKNQDASNHNPTQDDKHVLLVITLTFILIHTRVIIRSQTFQRFYARYIDPSILTAIGTIHTTQRNINKLKNTKVIQYFQPALINRLISYLRHFWRTVCGCATTVYNISRSLLKTLVEIMLFIRSRFEPYRDHIRALHNTATILSTYSSTHHHHHFPLHLPLPLPLPFPLPPPYLWLLEYLTGESPIYLIFTSPYVPFLQYIQYIQHIFNHIPPDLPQQIIETSFLNLQPQPPWILFWFIRIPMIVAVEEVIRDDREWRRGEMRRVGGGGGNGDGVGGGGGEEVGGEEVEVEVEGVLREYDRYWEMRRWDLYGIVVLEFLEIVAPMVGVAVLGGEDGRGGCNIVWRRNGRVVCLA